MTYDFLNFTTLPSQNLTVVMVVNEPYTQTLLLIQTACLFLILLILLKRKTVTHEKSEDSSLVDMR